MQGYIKITCELLLSCSQVLLISSVISSHLQTLLSYDLHGYQIRTDVWWFEV